MSAPGLAITAAAALVAAAAFAWVAIALSRRPASPENRAAAVAFAAWWALLAAQSATDAGRVLLGFASPPDPAPYVSLAIVKILAAGAGVGAMAYYLLRLWGAPRWSGALAIPLGAAHGALFLYLLMRRLPATIEVRDWTTRLVLTQPSVLGGAAQAWGTALFFLPSILFALAYLALLGRVKDRTGRARLLGVAIALLVFHAAAILQYDPDRSDTVLTPLLSAASATAAAIVLLTYWPPGWAQRRWGLEPLSPTAPSARPGRPPAGRQPGPP